MDPVLATGACAFLAAAAVADLRSRKISNKLNVTAALLALALQLFVSGPSGLVAGLVGLLVGFAVLFLPFACGLVGGGDVKFAAAAGAFLGWRILLVGLASGIILGGIVGVVSLISQGRMASAMKNLWGDLYGIASGVRPTTLSQAATVQTIPYGVTLAIGLAGALAAHIWRLM